MKCIRRKILSKDDRCFGAIECARERKHDLLKDEDGGRRDRKRDFICAFVRGYLGKRFHLQRLTLSRVSCGLCFHSPLLTVIMRPQFTCSPMPRGLQTNRSGKDVSSWKNSL